MLAKVQVNKLFAKLCLVLFCCYIPLAISQNKPHTEMEARQCSKDNNCDRMKENARRYAQAWCSDDGGIDHLVGYDSCSQDGLFCETRGHIYCKGKQKNQQSWYGCHNCKTPKDREGELSRMTGGFNRNDVPPLPDHATWNDLCNSIRKKCIRVADWEWQTKSCADWALDGSRVALCEDR